MRLKHKSTRHIWFRIFTLLAIGLTIPLLSGCSLWTKARRRAVDDHRQLMEALSPLADPNGGAYNSRARDVEKEMARSQTMLP